MARFFNSLNIRSKLLLSFLGLVFFPLVLITAFTFEKSSEAMKRNSEIYTQDVLIEISRVIDAHYLMIERQYFMVFTNDLVQTGLKQAQRGKLNEYAQTVYATNINNLIADTFAEQEDIYSIYILSNTDDWILAGYPKKDVLGQFYQMTPEQKRRIDRGMGRAVWMGLSPDHSSIAWGRVINSLTTFRPIGYFTLYLNEDALFEMYGNVEFSGVGELFLVDAEGTIISHADKDLLGTRPKQDYIRGVLSGDEQGFFDAEIDGKAHYVAYKQIEKTGWRIVCLMSAAQYEADIVSLRGSLIVFAVLFLAAVFAFAVYLSSTLSRPIRDLSFVMSRVGEGDITVRSEYESGDELGLLSKTFNNMVEQIDVLIYEAYEEEILKQKAELESLKLQINPHFLYNTLDTINWSAQSKGAYETAELAKALGDLMREALGRQDIVPLSKEVQGIRNYLLIQKARYSERLTVQIEIGESAEKLLIPKLILQPVVENAIAHGIEPMLEPGIILVLANVERGELVIEVIDNGMGIPEDELERLWEPRHYTDPGRHARVGIQNVDRRIKLYYGEQYGLTVSSSVGYGTRVTMRLPEKK